MKKNLPFLVAVSFVLTSLTCCEKENAKPEEKENPFINEERWNGFIINDKEYNTPNAIIEVWGENLDSLSSDYDISFTDGTFDYDSRNIIQDNILLFLDANSPTLDNFSPGTYYIENTNERKPGNIVDAWMQITSEKNIIRYPILSGTVNVKEENGFFSIAYEFESIVENKTATITGNYSGIFTIIDQTRL